MYDTNDRLSTLHVYRHGAQHRVDSDAGYSVEVPRMAFPSEPPDQVAQDVMEDPESLLEHFDWADPRPVGTSFEHIRPVGMVERSAWKEFYLHWLSELLNAEILGETRRSATGPKESDEVARKLTAGKIEPWASPSAFLADKEAGQTTLRRTDTPRGEARAAARQVRTWLADEAGNLPEDAPEQLDDVLILLPEDSDALGRWKREFDRHDLPVDAQHTRSLANTGLAQWLLDVAELGEWGGDPKPRTLLRRVFEAPYWSAQAVAEAAGGLDAQGQKLRTVLRKGLRSLRRDMVSLERWSEHLTKLDSDWLTTQDKEFAAQFSQELTSMVADRANVFRRLYGVLVDEGYNDLGVRKRMMVSDEARPVYDRTRRTLAGLARREQRLDQGGADSDLEAMREGNARPSQILESAFEGHLVTSEENRPDKGVTLMPARLYDGCPSNMLIVAGLG